MISFVLPTFQKFSPRYPQVLLVTFILSWSLLSAVWTFPFKIIINNNLAVISAHMAIIRFCIEFRILDVIINIFHNFFQCMAGCSAYLALPHKKSHHRKKSLWNCAFKFKFTESINFLTHIHMIGIGIISFIRYIFDRHQNVLYQSQQNGSKGFLPVFHKDQNRFRFPLSMYPLHGADDSSVLLQTDFPFAVV